jgi:uncharacterized protein (TIGR02996 family)
VDQAGAFLQSILETPDDDAPRLIYADWLDDQGDADRAEFIRLQVARAGLHPADARARPMLRREAELLRRHEHAWLGRLSRLAQRCWFHRGFVEEVAVGVEQLLLDGDEMFRLAPVRRLRLRNGNALPALMQSNPAVADRLADLLRPVRGLNLNFPYLSEPAGLALLSLPRPPRLEALHLTNNTLSVPGVSVLAGSEVLASLTTLEFNTALPSRESIEVLLRSPHLANLRHLSLNGIGQGDRVAGLLAGSPLLPRLRSLSLCHAGLTSDGLAELAGRAVALESLELSFNPLGPAGVRELTRAPQLGRLTWLNLSRARVGNEGASALARSDLMARLIGIDLSLNRVGDEGASALARAPEDVSPGTVDLIYNPLGAAARDALARRFGDDVCLFKR